MSDKLALSDLHEARYRGDGGIQRTMSGAVAIPLGLNPMYHSPQIAQRRYWDAAARAGGRDAHAGEFPALTRCSRCKILIGRGYYEREIYLLAATLESKSVAGRLSYTPRWRFICGSCATIYLPDHTDQPISFGFCLLCEADWGVPLCHHLLKLNVAYVEHKIADLNRQVIPAWNDYFRQVKAGMVRQGNTTFLALNQTRSRAFERWIYQFDPTPLTYSELALPRAA